MNDIRPGVHYGMSMAEYLVIQAVSKGVLETLLDRCPAAAWHASPFNPKRLADDTEATDAGTMAHAIFLEDSVDCLQVIDPRDYPAERTGNIPDGWTNKAIRAARDAARAAGKIPVFPADYAEIRALVGSARQFVENLMDTEPAVWEAFKDGKGASEVVFVWEEGATLCKARADRVARDFGVVIDYKTTKASVEPNTWARTNLDYLGAAWYRRGIRALTGVVPDYVFLAGERERPYLHSLLGVTPADLDLGDEKVGAALRQWQECERAHIWPGYPNRVAYAEVPHWHRLQWDERNGVAPDGIPYDISKLFAKREAQA